MRHRWGGGDFDVDICMFVIFNEEVRDDILYKVTTGVCLPVPRGLQICTRFYLSCS